MWFEENHDKRHEAWIGFCRKDSGKPSITYADAVDAALCFGWIDGIRKRIDETRYTNRFTPRTPTSSWSQVNLRRFEELQRRGRVHASGLEAFERRTQRSQAQVAYENRRSARLDPAMVRRFRQNTNAWKFFQSEPTGRRQLAIVFVMSAKREETRERRLDAIIAACAKGKRVGVLETSKPPASSGSRGAQRAAYKRTSGG